MSAHRAHHLATDGALARAVPTTSSLLAVTVAGDAALVTSTSVPQSARLPDTARVGMVWLDAARADNRVVAATPTVACTRGVQRAPQLRVGDVRRRIL
jgi:hypothetical protein